MLDKRKFYIDGQWVDPLKPNDLPVINPATEQPIAVISMGTAADIDRAVAAAKKAFQTYSQTSVEERLALLEKLLDIYKRRYEEMARTITLELGAPITIRPSDLRRNIRPSASARNTAMARTSPSSESCQVT